MIDILGLSDAMSDPLRSRRYAEALAGILSPIVRQKDEPWLVLNHVRDGREVEIETSIPPTRGTVVTSISDAIVLSVPYGTRLSGEERLRRILVCLVGVQALQRSLLSLGILTRGGMAVGGLIHKSHLVVGDGLVKAHEIEKTRAVVPRTVVDQPIIEALLSEPWPEMALFRNRIAHLIRQDADAEYFVDYLASDPVLGRFMFHREAVNVWTQLRKDIATTTNDRVKAKLEWTAAYLLASSGELQRKEPRIVDHADASFSKKFYRSQDSIVTWSKRLEKSAKEVTRHRCDSDS